MWYVNFLHTHTHTHRRARSGARFSKKAQELILNMSQILFITRKKTVVEGQFNFEIKEALQWLQ